MAGLNKRNLLKKKKESVSCCLRNPQTAAGAAKREEEGHKLLQTRAPHGLTKVGQQGLRGIAVPRET